MSIDMLMDALREETQKISDMEPPIPAWAPPPKESAPPAPAPKPAGKTCATCKEWKPASEYHRRRSGRDGLQSVCKDCSRQRSRKRVRRGHAAADPKTPGRVKRCSGCGETFFVTEFYRNAASPDGLQHRCKACFKQHYLDRRKEVLRQGGQQLTVHFCRRPEVRAGMEQLAAETGNTLSAMVVTACQYYIKHHGETA